MKVVIIEDEVLAQQKLEELLKRIDPEVVVVARLGSVKEAKEYFSHAAPPDVAFVDIQLSDDHSFEIFNGTQMQFPVVFTTAYDQYLLESFEHNAIDYLLKPISEDKLRRSLTKLRNLEMHFFHGNLQRLMNAHREKRDRIIARKGSEFVALKFGEIAYFFTEHKIVFVRAVDGRQLLLDKTLSELENLVDPKQFFRLNRKFLSNIEAIEKFKSESGKIRVLLKPGAPEDVFVSKETAPDFRRWIGDV